MQHSVIAKKMQYILVLLTVISLGSSGVFAADRIGGPSPVHSLRSRTAIRLFDNSTLINNRPNSLPLIFPLIRIYDAATNTMLAEFEYGNLSAGGSETFTLSDYTNVYILFNALGGDFSTLEVSTLSSNGTTIFSTLDTNNTLHFGNGGGGGFNITSGAVITIN